MARAKVGPGLEVVPSNYQHKGARDSQEDAFAFSNLQDEKMVEEIGVLAVLADGMGGLSMGGTASSVAVDGFLKEYILKQPDEPIAQGLERALRKANIAVFDLALQDGVELEMGTTLAAAVVYRENLHWVSVGDSCIYHFRNGNLTQLNKSHIYANHLQEEVRNNKITRTEAENHPERDHLTSYLGLSEVPEVDINFQPLTLVPGDQVLLCSDGLSNTLSNEEICAHLQNGSIHVAELLVNHALSKSVKYQDNITVVVLKCQTLE